MINCILEVSEGNQFISFALAFKMNLQIVNRLRIVLPWLKLIMIICLDGTNEETDGKSLADAKKAANPQENAFFGKDMKSSVLLAVLTSTLV